MRSLAITVVYVCHRDSPMVFLNYLYQKYFPGIREKWESGRLLLSVCVTGMVSRPLFADISTRGNQQIQRNKDKKDPRKFGCFSESTFCLEYENAHMV